MLLTEKKQEGAPDKWRSQKRWNNTHRLERRAHAIVRQALRKGDLKRGKCKCGSLKVLAHHSDYSQPLEVEWMCALCHRRHHAALRRLAA